MALAAIKSETTLTELAQQYDVHRLTDISSAVAAEASRMTHLGHEGKAPLSTLSDRCSWNEATFADASGSDGLRAEERTRSRGRVRGRRNFDEVMRSSA